MTRFGSMITGYGTSESVGTRVSFAVILLWSTSR